VVVGIGIAVKLLTYILGVILGIVVPVVVLVGIVYVLYNLFGRKSIGGGRRRYLP
jgi:hypothetical protein